MKKQYIDPDCSIVYFNTQSRLCQTSIQYGATNEAFQPDTDGESYF